MDIKKTLIRSFINAVGFGVVYGLLTYISDQELRLEHIVFSSCVYFMVIFIFYNASNKIKQRRDTDVESK